MPLPESGEISLSQIVEEYSPGRKKPWRLTDYYKGAGYVPNNSGTTSIPTSGQISLSDFQGTSNLIRVEFDYEVHDKPYDGNDEATATLTITNALEGDDVRLEYTRARFVNANLGRKTARILGIYLAGDDADKYTIQGSSATTTATITGVALRLPWIAEYPAGVTVQGYDADAFTDTRFEFNNVRINYCGAYVVRGIPNGSRIDFDQDVVVNHIFYNGSDIIATTFTPDPTVPSQRKVLTGRFANDNGGFNIIIS